MIGKRYSCPIVRPFATCVLLTSMVVAAAAAEPGRAAEQHGVWDVTRSAQALPLPNGVTTWSAMRIANLGNEPVDTPNALTKGQVDLSDLDAVVQHVLRDDMTDAERALALHEFVVRNSGGGLERRADGDGTEHRRWNPDRRGYRCRSRVQFGWHR